MTTTRQQTRHVLLKIESYEGEDTFLKCGDDRQDYLYAILAIDADGTAEIVDSGYRSAAEARQAWPEAEPRLRTRRR